MQAAPLLGSWHFGVLEYFPSSAEGFPSSAEVFSQFGGGVFLPPRLGANDTVFASGEIRQIASVEKRQFGSAEIRQFESIEKSQS